MFTLQDVSFESDLVVDNPETHFDPTIKNPLTQKEYNDCIMVIETYKGVNERGYITRHDVSRLHGVRDDFPHLDKFFKKYPLNSFTTEPSSINYEVSNENFLLTIGKAIIAAIKATINWIIEKAQSLWKWFTSTTSQSSKVEGLRENLIALQNYVREVIPIVKSSQTGDKFKLALKRVMDTQLHNANKKWNALAEDVHTNEGTYGNYVSLFCGVLQSEVPGFVDNTLRFMDLLKAAKTEDDIKQAVDLNTLVRGGVNVNGVVSLALSLGYNPNTRRKDGVSEWQAKCQSIVGSFRAKVNDRRAQLTESELTTKILNAKLSDWSKAMKEAEDTLGDTIPETIKKLRAFDVSSLNPGLEAAYHRYLVNYLPGLVSTLQGFSHLQEAVGLIANVRDTSVYVLSEAALGLVKGTDKFITDNFDSLTLSEQVIRNKHKKSIMAVFK